MIPEYKIYKSRIDFIRAIKKPCDNAKSLNYLLVMPKLTQNYEQHYDFPTGIAYISSTLKLSGRNIFTLNLNYKNDDIYTIISHFIKINDIDVLATGGLSSHYNQIYAIITAAKKAKPQIITIVGGGIITADPIPAMTALEYADFGIIGEGEITICDLAKSLEQDDGFETVQGLIYKVENEIWKITENRSEIMNLDVLPIPDYDGFSFEETLGKVPYGYHGIIKADDRLCVLVTSRSCPYSCTFCFHTSGKHYRRRSLDNIFNEIDYLVNKYGITTFYISDELFGNDKSFLYEFCERIRLYGLRWTVNLRVDIISKELLGLFKDSGCNGLVLGLESADDRILRSMKKNITVDQIENALSLITNMKMSFVGNFIFGDLQETYETAMNTLNWWRIHPEYTIKLLWIIVYPGSYLYYEACRKGTITDRVQYLKDGPSDINVSQLTDVERNEIANLIDNMRQIDSNMLNNVKLSQDKMGLLRIEGNCNYCNSLNILHHCELFLTISREYCCSCGEGISVYPYDYVDPEIFDRNLNMLVSIGEIAIWPVITGVYKIIDWSSAAREERVHFVDSSKSKQGRILYNNKIEGSKEFLIKTIESPDIILQNKIETVIITNAQGSASPIINIIKTEYLSVKRICFAGEMIFANFVI